MIEFFSLPQEKKDEIVAKFNINVDKDEEHGGCWRWLGESSRYGHFRFLPDSKKVTGAHRFAWAIKYSTPVPPQLLCCHSCDNPICVNPEHIFIGTHKQNMADCILKRRHMKEARLQKEATDACKKEKIDSKNRGGRRRKRSTEVILEVVEYVLKGHSLKNAGKQFGIAPQTIHGYLFYKEVIDKYGTIDLSHRLSRKVVPLI